MRLASPRDARRRDRRGGRDDLRCSRDYCCLDRRDCQALFLYASATGFVAASAPWLIRATSHLPRAEFEFSPSVRLSHQERLRLIPPRIMVRRPRAAAFGLWGARGSGAGL
jgi:hypothetical protein